MRLLIIAPPPDGFGPVSKHTPVLAEGLEELGCDVDLVYRRTSGPEAPVWSRVTCRLSDVPRIGQVFFRREYDAVVLRTAHDFRSLVRDMPILLAARAAGQRVVIQFHGSNPRRLQESRLFRRLTSAVLDLCEGVLLLSTEELQAWKKHWPRRRFEVVHNPVPPLPAYSKPPDSEIEANPILVFVGRMIEEKGCLDLVDAFAQTVQEAECRLVMAGAGSALPEVRERIRRLGLEDRVTLTGWVTGDALWDVYRSGAIFVLPSSWREGQPTVLSEAAHFGLPIITTRIRAAPDLFEEGVNALFVPPRSPRLLADAILLLLRQPELRRRMGVANRELAKSLRAVPVARKYLAGLRACLTQADR